MIIIWLNFALSDIDQIQGDIFCSGTFSFSVSKSYGRTPYSCFDSYFTECHCVRHRFCILRCFVIVRNRIEIQTGIQTFAFSRDDIRPLIRNKCFILFLIAVWINVDLVPIIQAQCHRLLRHRPRGAPAQQAAKQQRHPLFHIFFLPGCAARLRGAVVISLMVHYTLPLPRISRGGLAFSCPKQKNGSSRFPGSPRMMRLRKKISTSP